MEVQEFWTLYLFTNLMFLLGYWSIRSLREKHGRDIHTVWSAYFFFAVLGSEICFAAEKLHAVDEAGIFHGQLGHWYSVALNFFLDLKGDMWILVGILGLVVVPQSFAYGFSGVSGSAQTPWLERFFFRFLLWLLIKAFVTTAALALSFSLIGLTHNWRDWGRGTSCLLALESVFLVSASFVLLGIFYEAEQMAAAVKKLDWLACMHRWMTRKGEGLDPKAVSPLVGWLLGNASPLLTCKCICKCCCSELVHIERAAGCGQPGCECRGKG